MTQMIDLFHSLSDHKQQLHFAVLSSALSTEHPTHHCFTAQWQLCVQKKLHEWSTIHPGLLPTTISFCWWKVAESSQARVACKKHILSETLSLPPQHCPALPSTARTSVMRVVMGCESWPGLVMIRDQMFWPLEWPGYTGQVCDDTFWLLFTSQINLSSHQYSINLTKPTHDHHTLQLEHEEEVFDQLSKN